MDILTHSIVGATWIEGILQFRKRRAYPTSVRLKFVLWVIGLTASVFPDFDIVFAWMTTGGKLGAFVHHQGYLHAPFVLILLAAAATLACRRWVNRWKELERDDWFWVFGTACGAAVLHVLLDAMTSHGIHLLWPFSAGWSYGDTLYTIEPWLWVCLLPALFLHRENPRVRFAAAILFVFLLIAIWFSGRVPWYAALAMTVVGVGLWRGVRPLSDASRLAIGSGLAALTLTSLFALSQDLEERVRASHWLEKGNLELQDVVLTAMPGNPLCWWLVAVEGDESHYRLKSGVIAAFPRLVPATQCPLLGATTPTLKMEPVVNARPETILWAGQYRETREALARWLESHCAVAAYFRAARAPYLQEVARDLLMGDLRYDRQPGLGFGEVQVSVPPRHCPSGVPRWRSPRREIIL